ncbi:MAG: GNAT family N-acetyltransferase [Chloroflexi bacterium]|nr:GNAT family N-acetyltransferase [Chloroflexota bacterium]
MILQVIPAQSEHIEGLARSCIAAFAEFNTQHLLTMGTPGNVESARQMYSRLLVSDRAHVIVALQNGEVVGSTWLRLEDDIAAFEDVNTAPSKQGNGVARALMTHGLEVANGLGYAKIRLTQSAHNSTALSLYASLGFEVKETFAEMKATTGKAPELPEPPGVRPMTEADLPAIKDVSRRLYKLNRRGDVAAALASGEPALVVAPRDGVTGYVTLGGSAHGMAESEAEALALITEAARRYPEKAVFGCPLSLHGLFRKALQIGYRTLEVHNVMAYGPYERPGGVWMPSSAY